MDISIYIIDVDVNKDINFQMDIAQWFRKSTEFGVKQIHVQALSPPIISVQICRLINLSLNFLICKMKTIIEPT